ncbi:MAG: metalloprotease TldD [Rhodocyclaceae bacterium]|jgi:TldD protein|nr:metalloprotease TldD [Rhodocyclaceae bacterium]
METITPEEHDALQLAENVLLEAHELSVPQVEHVLDHILAGQVDDADIYFQKTRSEGWSLEEGIVKAGSFSIDQGVGVRAISGEKTAFAYSDDVSLPSLKSASAAVREIGASGGQNGQAQHGAAKETTSDRYLPLDPIASLAAPEKVALLEKLEHLARAIDPRVKQVMASLSGEYDVIMVQRADGRRVADVRPLVRLGITVIVEENGRREQGYAGGGGRTDYGYFTEAVLTRYAQEAVHQAVVNLGARPAPAGQMPVVLGPGWPGILLHEAIGHGLEGDFNRKGSSAFANRIGERVAAPGVTVVDDGTLSGRRGSLNVDDEGTPAQKTVLIEDGILKGYIQDTHNARLMGVAPTGNGRRESYAHLPLPRMTNTYMLPGQLDPQEIVASIDRGIYAVNFGGGQVDITNGKFVFSMSEAYWVENGQIQYPIKGATLIGNGPDALTRVSMVGNDLALDSGVGTCGKEGQSVPVGVGQPTLRIDGLTIGGTGAA